MKPTDILINEHRIIRQVLDCLAKIADRCETDGRLDGRSAQEAVSFFRHFADQCHHAKEEDHLFPAMEARGFPRECGPTGVMMFEHEQVRDHIRMMDESIDAASRGDPAAIQKFIQHSRAYNDLMRSHIEKEDNCLFSMADEAFTEKDRQKLLLDFEKVEDEEIGAGVHQKCVSIANELADRFRVPRAPTSHSEPGTGHCRRLRKE